MSEHSFRTQSSCICTWLLSECDRLHATEYDT